MAFNGTDEAQAAVHAAIELARGMSAELEIIGVFSAESFSAPALMGGPSAIRLRQDLELHAQETLDAIVGEAPSDVAVSTVRLAGDPAEELEARSSSSTCWSSARAATARCTPCSSAASAPASCGRRRAR